MGKNGIPEQQKFNYGKHREKYQKEIFQLIEDIKNIPNDKKSEEINNYFVIKLYTLLKNFGIYKDYDIYNTIEYFKKEEAIFYQKLEEYLSDVNNKRKIYKSLFIIKNQILNIRDFSSNGFYQDFLDDLKSEMGLMIKTKYNNFIEPSIYNCSEDFSSIDYKHFDMKYEDNQAINKKVLAEYKRLAIGGSNA
ncbi:hypothetical protein [Brachyspira pilosicoli]|uniref:hypothetical protein n=1 Tax=Brachyspira pilosicoli TaxID=52584 RepID=UPI000E160CA0|nr:hypothetical protein [Brachyspira pilosicoli]MBW5392672.1 hypothetical protein [Brachyspira pilosicoli]SUW05070.1 unclassified [Brachyspira pilosicoli]SUW06202.1 unclassified [Brachyspira pilosicoli]SUW09075.1 unclassified [Brachyspira pilosicoli]